MNNVATVVLIPLLVIILGYIIEYWIIQPLRNKADNRFLNRIEQSAANNRVEVLAVISSKNDLSTEHPFPWEPYYLVSIGLIGGGLGFISAWIIKLTTTLAQQDSTFLFISLTAIIGGAMLALTADRGFEMEQHAFWQRLPLAVILGLVGGLIGPLVTCVGLIIIFMFLMLLVELNNTTFAAT